VISLKEFTLPKDFRGKPAAYVLLWDIVNRLLFKPSPKIAYGWRRFLLRLFGAQIQRGVIIRPSVSVTYPWKLKIGEYSWIGDHVTLYTLSTIEIGNNSVISQHSYICTGTHDFKSKYFEILAHPITIGDGTWIAYGCFVGPGVNIGNECFVHATSKVTNHVLDKQIIK
jgi:putative colanic acid biosynthesis acetyltransferase WcaF